MPHIAGTVKMQPIYSTFIKSNRDKMHKIVHCTIEISSVIDRDRGIWLIDELMNSRT